MLMMLSVVGCQLKLDIPAIKPPVGLASEKPTKPKADPVTPTAAGTGHLRGRIFSQAGTSQPIGLAEVKASGQTVYSANPLDVDVVEESAANADQDELTVLHARGESDAPELALRILRKKPPADGPRYVYLNTGEFFFEHLPAGKVTVDASYGGAKTSVPVTIFKGKIVEDVSLRLLIPEPIATGPDGKVPPIVEWTSLTPTNGLSIAVTTRRETDNSGNSFVTTTLNYKPDPPDVVVTLRSPTGSPGTTISGYELVYEYTTPNLQAEGKPPIQIGPTRVTLAPLVVPAATATEPGEPVMIPVPVGSRSLNEVYSGPPGAQPSIITAILEFQDEKLVPVPNKDLNALRVLIPIRAL